MLTVNEAIEKLTPLLQQRKLIIFVGSGISIPSGLPSWDDFLKQFIDFCSDVGARYRNVNLNGLLSDELLRDAEAQKSRYPARVASVLKDKLSKLPEEIRSNVEDDFKDWCYALFTGKSPHRNHQLIIGTEYPYILTSNYDNLLEDAGKKTGIAVTTLSFQEPERIAAAIYNKRPAIIHVHGKKSDILFDRIVFTSEDYTRIIKKGNPGFSFALQTLFLNYSTLFVGYGASDPHLEDLVEEFGYFFNYNRSDELSRNYLVVRKAKAGHILEEYKRKLRTQLIEIDDFNDYQTLLSALQQIAPRGSAIEI